MDRTVPVGVALSIIFLLSGGVVFFAWHQQEEISSLGESVEKVLLIVNKKKNLHEPETKVLEAPIYTNTLYGFELAIPKEISGIQVLPGTFGEDSTLDFWFPTEDKEYSQNETLYGSALVFRIRISSLSRWKHLNEECKQETNPTCPYAVLGQNERYVFDYISAQEGPRGFDKLVSAQFAQAHFRPLPPDSFPVTRQRAEQLVGSFPEVKQWMAVLTSRKAVPEISVSDYTITDKTGTYWSVQVYESLVAHNVTHAWYQVDASNGKVSLVE